MALADKEVDLQIPSLTPPEKEGFSTAPKQVKKWLRDLPLANMGSTTQQVFKALEEVNTQDIKSDQRLEFLESLRPTIKYIIDGLRKNYFGKHLPLSDKNRDVVRFASSILNEMGTGYRILIQLHAHGKQKLPQKQLCQAIHRAIRYHSTMLVENYLVYSHELEGIWYLLHSLFLFSHHNNLLSHNVNDEFLVHHKHTSIESTYLQILLLAATDPYHLPLGDILKAFNELERYTHLAGLTPQKPEQKNDAVFLVKMHSDHPPVHVSSRRAKMERFCLFLDTRNLVETINRDIERSHYKGMQFWKKHPPIENEELLSRIVISFGAIPKRRFKRTDTSTRVAVVIGLSSINQVIAYENDLDGDAVPDHKARFVAKDIESDSNDRQYRRDVWNMMSSSPVESADDHFDLLYPNHSRERRLNAMIPQDWELSNISAGGYCVVADQREPSKSHIGELISIRELNTDITVWQTGVVKWIQTTEDGTVAMGVKILYPGGNPVVTKVKNDNGIYTGSERSLLLPAVKTINQPSTLLTPSHNYAVGKELQVRSGKQVARVVLTKLLMTTESFCQFEYVATNRSENLPLSNIAAPQEIEHLIGTI